TEDRDIRGIAAEGRDVRLYPAKRRNLIEDTLIARRAVRRLAREIGMREEAEQSKAVVQGDDDDVTAHDLFATGPFARRAREIAATGNPDHHGLRTTRGVELGRP